MPNSPALGRDFIGKWSSTRLLMQGKNPWNLDDLFVLEASQGWPDPEPVISRSPPFLHVLLIPFAVLPFYIGAAVWFLVNVFVLALSSKGLADLLIPGKGIKTLGLALLLTFTFSRPLQVVLIGQVNSLVLLGLVGFLWLLKKNQLWGAGGVLALTLVKPHLVYLALPLLLLEALLRRWWRILIAFAGVCLGLLGVATLLHPSWPSDYLTLLTHEATWATHTWQVAILRGVIYAHMGTDVGKYLWLVVLPLFLMIYLRYRERLELTSWLSLAVFAALPTLPFGGSTDLVLLLLPIFQIVGWILSEPFIDRRVAIPSLLLIYGYAFWFWVNFQELAFLPLPFMVGVLYCYALQRVRSTTLAKG